MLESYGIDMDAAMKWQRDGAKLEGAFWDNIYGPALLKYLNDTVITPRGTNMARWMSSSWMAPIRHLMTYTSIFANTVLPNMWFQLKGGIVDGAPNTLLVKGVRGAQAAGGITALYGMSMLSETLLDYLKYGGTEQHPLRKKIRRKEDWEFNQMLRFLNRSGIYGLAGAKVFDAIESYQYGSLDYRFIDGAFLTESTKAAEILGSGLLAGEISAQQAAKWLVRNAVPVYAAAIPRNKRAPLAEAGLPTRKEMERDLARWLDDYVPKVSRQYKSNYNIK